MEKINRTKLITVIIIALAVIAAIISIIIFVNGGKNKDKNPANISTNSEFEELKITNIEVSYSEDGTETHLNFLIENLTGKKVENQTIDIQLIDENGGVIVQSPITINAIESKSTYPVIMTLGGNIQGIKTIKLAESEKTETEAETETE